MKRIISLLLALALAVGTAFVLASCGASTGEKDLADVKAAGKLVVGMECAYAPYNWTQTTENEFTVKVRDGMYADGYDVQFAKLVANHLGVELVIKPYKWDGLIPALEAGEIDAVIAGMSPTAERRASIDFSDTYLNSNLVIVCKKNSAYASATDLSGFSGAKLSAQQNTFHYTVIPQIAGVNRQVALPDFAALIQALSADTIDGYVCEKPGAISAVTSDPSFMYVEFAEGKGFSYDPEEASIAVGVRRKSSLVSEINRVIASLSEQQRLEMMTAAIDRQPVGN